MSERLHDQPEKQELLSKVLHTPERSSAHAEVDPNKAAIHKQARLNEARQHILKESNGNSHIKELMAAETSTKQPTAQYINRELKQITLRRELKQIQRKLNAPSRTFSKVIHQPAVRLISEVADKSISRPSGLLGGGLMAFIGSAAYLYLAKHIGFTYNYGLFIAFFVGGFVLGGVIELLIYTATASRRRLE